MATDMHRGPPAGVKEYLLPAPAKELSIVQFANVKDEVLRKALMVMGQQSRKAAPPVDSPERGSGTEPSLSGIQVVTKVAKRARKGGTAKRVLVVRKSFLVLLTEEGGVKRVYHLSELRLAYYRTYPGDSNLFEILLEFNGGLPTLEFVSAWFVLEKLNACRYFAMDPPVRLMAKALSRREDMAAKRIERKPGTDVSEPSRRRQLSSLGIAELQKRRQREGRKEPDCVIVRNTGKDTLGMDLTNSLRLMGVVPGGHADRAGMGRHIGKRISHVANTPALDMRHMGDLTAGLTRVPLSLAEALGPRARGEEEVTLVKAPGYPLKLRLTNDMVIAPGSIDAAEFVGRRLLGMNGKRMRSLADYHPHANSHKVTLRFEALEEVKPPLPPMEEGEVEVLVHKEPGAPLGVYVEPKESKEVTRVLKSAEAKGVSKKMVGRRLVAVNDDADFADHLPELPPPEKRQVPVLGGGTVETTDPLPDYELGRDDIYKNMKVVKLRFGPPPPLPPLSPGEVECVVTKDVSGMIPITVDDDGYLVAIGTSCVDEIPPEFLKRRKVLAVDGARIDDVDLTTPTPLSKALLRFGPQEEVEDPLPPPDLPTDDEGAAKNNTTTTVNTNDAEKNAAEDAMQSNPQPAHPLTGSPTRSHSPPFFNDSPPMNGLYPHSASPYVQPQTAPYNMYPHTASPVHAPTQSSPYMQPYVQPQQPYPHAAYPHAHPSPMPVMYHPQAPMGYPPGVYPPHMAPHPMNVSPQMLPQAYPPAMMSPHGMSPYMAPSHTPRSVSPFGSRRAGRHSVSPPKDSRKSRARADRHRPSRSSRRRSRSRYDTTDYSDESSEESEEEASSEYEDGPLYVDPMLPVTLMNPVKVNKPSFRTHKVVPKSDRDARRR